MTGKYKSVILPPFAWQASDGLSFHEKAVLPWHGAFMYGREHVRGAGIGVLVIGIIIGLAGLANHYVIKANPIAHTSTIVGAVGAVIAVIGLVMLMMGGRSSTAS